MQKISIKRTVITDLCLAAIIICVYVTVFAGTSILSKPAFKGSTGQNKVGLQIAALETSDIDAYLDMLSEYEISATFFFDNRIEEDVKERIENLGHSTGRFEDGKTYPVMSYAQGTKKVSPSIDVTQLKESSDWQQVLEQSIAPDMLIFVSADNNFSEFEKIVQIVLDKGYTIDRMEEMF